jgi:hypothetical protein
MHLAGDCNLHPIQSLKNGPAQVESLKNEQARHVSTPRNHDIVIVNLLTLILCRRILYTRWCFVWTHLDVVDRLQNTPGPRNALPSLLRSRLLSPSLHPLFGNYVFCLQFLNFKLNIPSLVAHLLDLVLPRLRLQFGRYGQHTHIARDPRTNIILLLIASNKQI